MALGGKDRLCSAGCIQPGLNWVLPLLSTYGTWTPHCARPPYSWLLVWPGAPAWPTSPQSLLGKPLKSSQAVIYGRSPYLSCASHTDTASKKAADGHGQIGSPLPAMLAQQLSL